MPAFQMMNMWIDLAKDWDQTLKDANEVILDRTTSIVTGTIETDELDAMIIEKPFAVARSMQSMSMAMMRGGNPFWIAQETLSPFLEKTSQNKERLQNAKVL